MQARQNPKKEIKVLNPLLQKNIYRPQIIKTLVTIDQLLVLRKSIILQSRPNIHADAWKKSCVQNNEQLLHAL